MQVSRFFLLSAFVIFHLSGPEFSEAAGPKIISEHPRLFFRARPWDERGLTLDMIRERANRPEARIVLEQLRDSLPNLALRSLLLADDQSAARAIEELQTPLQWREITTDEGAEVGFRAMAFDWLYHHAAFTGEKKRKAAENIAGEAERLLREMDRSGPHIFHTRMYGWASGIALAGLALYGDYPNAQNLANFGYEYFKDKLFPARQFQDGTVHNGFGYGRKYTMWLTGHFISCWHSATGENLWEDIKDNQMDWARREILFLYYGRYPDRSYLRFGDSYSLFSDNYSFRAIAERAWAYDDQAGAGILQKMVEENQGKVVEKSTAYIYFLFFDSEARGVSPYSLPTKMLFSPKGTGMVIWKSSWSPEATSIFFKCGNYFDDHGHFDQGHLDVFRNSTLLLDSGSYLTFSGHFRTEYWHRTVAHNSILVLDPAIPGDEGGQRVFHSQSDSTMAQYLSNRQSETGDIIEYREEPGLQYVAGNITAAYPADRVKLVTRELAFIDDRYLVVLDRIVIRRKGLVPKVLWHTPLVPQMEPREGRFKISRNGARMEVTTLLPEKARLEWIAGFVAGGKSIPPVGELKGIPDMGAGRIEVSRKGGKENLHLFVHVLDIGDTEDTPTPLKASVGQNLIRVSLGKRTLAFKENSAGWPH